LRSFAGAIALLALLAAGCGDDSDSDEPATTPAQTQAPTATTQAAAEPLVINVQQGVGGARLGMSEAEVREQLGAPARVATGLKNAQGEYTEFTYPGQFTVAFQRGQSLPPQFNGGASSFYLTEANAKTPQGIGVGSTEAEVREGVPGVKCAGGPTCHVGDVTRPGGAITQFGIAAGRVTFVRIAYLVRG
jgi:hypothetical protein